MTWYQKMVDDAKIRYSTDGGKTVFLAERDAHGRIFVNTFDGAFEGLRYVAHYDDVQEMTCDIKEMLKRFPEGYVCSISGKKESQLILVYKGGKALYIKIME